MGIRNYIRKPINLLERYGKATWAVVTGATGGIGQQYWLQLAQQGFNIVVFGRSKESIEEIENKIKLVNGSVKIKVVWADLGADLSAKFYQDIYNQIKDLDISILVNNAGWVEDGYFKDIPLQTEINNYRVTAASAAMLTRFLINKLLERKNKSALINVSSIDQNSPLPYEGTYSASKRFLTLFSYHIHDNYKSKIDVQDLQPGWVTTKMSGNRTGIDTISSERCVESSLRDLGQELSCHPSIAHSIHAQVFHTLNRFCKPLHRKIVDEDSEMSLLRQFYSDHK